MYKWITMEFLNISSTRCRQEAHLMRKFSCAGCRQCFNHVRVSLKSKRQPSFKPHLILLPQRPSWSHHRCRRTASSFSPLSLSLSNSTPIEDFSEQRLLLFLFIFRWKRGSDNNEWSRIASRRVCRASARKRWDWPLLQKLSFNPFMANASSVFILNRNKWG